MLNKIRPNVWYMAAIVGLLTFVFLGQLVGIMETSISGELYALVVGVGLGGLVSVMSQTATDPPAPAPPMVPAEVHLEALKAVK